METCHLYLTEYVMMEYVTPMLCKKNYVYVFMIFNKFIAAT